MFIVATTHLKARKSDLLSKLRNEQAHDLLAFIDEYMLINNYSKLTTPVIITGDFNGEKNEPFFATMTKHLASAYDAERDANRDADKNDENDNNLINSKLINCHSNWTRRVNEEEIKQTIDYIFYDANLARIDALLELNCNQLVTPIPNAIYPSDHLAIAAKISFI